MSAYSTTGPGLRELFLGYFRAHGHALLSSASLIPENDPTVLFTTAGMHPLVPFLRGQPHPQGKRLASVQKCLRTDDIEEVGDATHLTFFEMLGNWSLGDYFKEEAIALSFEFLTSDRWLSIPVERLAITCFAGDADAPRDEESARIWRRQGIPADRVFFFGKKENWWGPAGTQGPCGPDTEMFFDTGKPGRAPNDGTERFVEIWNDVFMEYEKRPDSSYGQLSRKNVDTGMGLERTVAVLNGLLSVYETDLFVPIFRGLGGGETRTGDRNLRVAADHLRAAVFVLADPRGIVPSNIGQGYVVRRLLRRAFRALEVSGVPFRTVEHLLFAGVLDAIAQTYGDAYPEVRERKDRVDEQLNQEFARYAGIRVRAEQELRRRRDRERTHLSGKEAFDLYQSQGFHPDLLRSLGEPLGISVDMAGFDAELAKHQEVSRAGIRERFAGGLADHAQRTVRLHTATHLLHESLRRVLGTQVEQKGSNITAERLRFDFSHPKKLAPEEIQTVETLVNQQIRRDLPVTQETMTPEEAKRVGALGFFGEKYGDQVKVYTVGDFSKEICGGPHVPHTAVIGRFRIVKEEGLSAGVRRIRAVVDPPSPKPVVGQSGAVGLAGEPPKEAR